MELTKDFLKQSEILTSGATGYIMKHISGYTYKIYKDSYNHILNGEEYGYDITETKRRIEYIVSQKDNVRLTHLPKDVLTYQGKTAGVELTYFKNSITLKEYLLNNPETDLVKLKEILYKIVGELIDNGIVPTDPNFENFLVTPDENGKMSINMVDVDDIYVSIYPNNSRDVWYESEVATCYRIIDLSFEDIKQKSL